MLTQIEMYVGIVIVILAIAIVYMTYKPEKMTARGGRSRAEHLGGKTVTLHYAPWCGYCKVMKAPGGTWEQVKLANPDITFVEINEDENKTDGINRYPTIVMMSSGGRTQYTGTNNIDALNKFVRS